MPPETAPHFLYRLLDVSGTFTEYYGHEAAEIDLRPQSFRRFLPPRRDLYRRASSLRMPRQTRRDGHSNILPIGNRRYSRLETGWKPALRRKGRTLSTTLRCRLSFRRRHRPDQLVEIIRYIWPEE